MQKNQRKKVDIVSSLTVVILGILIFFFINKIAGLIVALLGAGIRYKENFDFLARILGWKDGDKKSDDNSIKSVQNINIKTGNRSPVVVKDNKNIIKRKK